MKTRLNWKKKWLDDKSGYWFSAKVPVLGWEYIIDVYEMTWARKGVIEDYKESFEFHTGVFFSSKDDDVTKISKKHFKTEEEAKECCEKHLMDIAEKFNKWVKTK